MSKKITILVVLIAILVFAVQPVMADPNPRAYLIGRAATLTADQVNALAKTGASGTLLIRTISAPPGTPR